MPTESSVVSDLIRNLNTRQLPSEPSDDFLFQPNWAQPVPQRPQQQPQSAAAVANATTVPAAVAKKPVAQKAPRAARAKVQGTADAHWWQFAVAILVVGGWMYGANLIDSNEKPSVPAAMLTPTLTVPPRAPVVVTAEPIAQPGAAAVVPAEPPAAPADVPTVADPTTTTAKHHRGPAKVKHKRVKATSEAATEAKAAPEPEKKKAEAPAPAAAPPPPPPAPAKPTGPVRQSNDTENPLK